MLHVNDLTFRYGERTLFDHATVAIPDGAKVGFVGRNGAGKSTLFRLIAGEVSPETGSITLPRNARVGQVAQEAPSGDASLVSIVLAADRERAALLAEAETSTDAHRIGELHTRLADIDAHSAEARAASILAGLGFDEPTQQGPVSALSGGWRMRVALAATLFAEPDLLLLDEPTNYLDLEGVLWLETFIARYPRTVIIISHDRDLLNRAVDTIVHLDHGKLVVYRGGYDAFDAARREAQSLQLKLKKKQDDQRRHMEEFVERFRFKATKARQAQSRLKMLARMQPIVAVADESVVPFNFPEPAKKAAPPIIAMDDVAVGYGDKTILRKLNLRIDDDDRIGLLGSNGNGKSTLAKLLAGRLAAQSGKVRRLSWLSVAFFAQHQLEELSPDQSAYDHVRKLMPDATEAEGRARTGSLGFTRSKMDTPARDLSGGEKARLLLGLATFGGPNLMILDEPTNHLDIDSREALVMALAEYPGAVILISHDRHLIESSVDRLWLVADGTVKPFDGDVDDYRRMVLDARSGTPAADGDGRGEANAALQRRRDAAKRREETAPLRRRIRDTEAAMEKLRKDIAKIDLKLGDGTIYVRDPAEASKLAKSRSDAEKAMAAAEESWLHLSSELEAATADG